MTKQEKHMSSSRYAVAAACLALGLSVSACGSNPTNNAPAAATNQSGGQPDRTTNGRGMGGPSGSGKVAAVAGSTAQVQGDGAQVAVTWTAKTTFTQQVSAKASDLKVGDCVMAMPAMDSTPDSSDSTSKLTAATVRISTSVDGSCTNGMRGPASGVQRDQTAPPDGARGGTEQGDPKDGNGPARRGSFGAVGKVTAVVGTGFTVESVRPDSSESSTVSVTTSADTTWTRSAKATSNNVNVGRCVASVGKPDSTGAITATSIAISQPVNGECVARFGPGSGARPRGDDEGGAAQDS
jgi:hypothetical protein